MIPIGTKKQESLSHAALLERLHFDSITGEIRWKYNSNYTGLQSGWNKRYAGTIAGKKLTDGYSNIRIDGFDYLAHRLMWFAINGEWSKDEIDHIDGNKTNNRISNLREATRVQNLWNRGASPRNITGVKGVYYRKKYDDYVVQIKHDGKTVHLGVFKDLSSAKDAFKEKEFELRGEFAHDKKD